MSTFQTTTDVVYQDETYSVGGICYIELEDKLEALEKVIGLSESERDAAIEWITYNALMAEGIFVSKPKMPEPDLAKTYTTEEEEELNASIPTQPPQETIWSQSKILLEKEKLLRKEAALLKKERELFEQEKRNERTIKSVNAPPKAKQFYHPDGTPYSEGAYLGSIFTLIMVFGLLFFIVWFCAHTR
jgi:hypothetical protein